MRFDCCQWVDSSSDYFLLNITAAVINLLLYIRINIIDSFNMFPNGMAFMSLYCPGAMPIVKVIGQLDRSLGICRPTSALD